MLVLKSLPMVSLSLSSVMKMTMNMIYIVDLISDENGVPDGRVCTEAKADG